MSKTMKTHRLKIEIEFISRGSSSLNHNLMGMRIDLETKMPFVMGEITKFDVEKINSSEEKET